MMNVIHNFQKSVQEYDQFDHRNNEWIEKVKKILDCSSFYQVGIGKYGIVFSSNNYNYVLKIFMKDSAYLKWIKFCMDNKNNPYVPKIRGKVLKLTNFIYAIRLEKLTPTVAITEPFREEYYNWQNDNSYRSGDKDIDAILDHFTKNKKLLDLHNENVMMRGKQMVIIDPYYNWFDKGSKSYTIDPDDIDMSVF